MPSLNNKRTYTSEDYWSLPECERAELIDGQLYAMAPPNRIHQKLVSELTQVIGQYMKSQKKGCEVYPAPFAVNLDANDKNWVEPDISVICDRHKLTERGCSGAPDFIIEVVSPSTQSIDYLKKMFLYQRYHVGEYWIVNPATKSVNVYIFADSESASYSFDDRIPVRTYGGGLTICMAELLLL